MKMRTSAHQKTQNIRLKFIRQLWGNASFTSYHTVFTSKLNFLQGDVFVFVTSPDLPSKCIAREKKASGHTLLMLWYVSNAIDASSIFLTATHSSAKWHTQQFSLFSPKKTYLKSILILSSISLLIRTEQRIENEVHGPCSSGCFGLRPICKCIFPCQSTFCCLSTTEPMPATIVRYLGRSNGRRLQSYGQRSCRRRRSRQSAA